MNRFLFPPILLLLLLIAPRLVRADDAPALAPEAAPAPVYELRVYTCEPGKLEALHTRFRNHTLGIFEKHGMKNVAYWVPLEGPTAENTLIYILEHASREAAEASWAAFRADPEWQEVARQSEQEHGKILAKAPEATFLAATDYSPAVGPVNHDHVYELRIYTAEDGKLEPLHERFRTLTMPTFDKHGMGSVAYWAPLDEPQSQNMMYYVLEYESRDDARAKWHALGADEEFRAAFNATQVDGVLVRGRPESIYLGVVDYSPQPEEAGGDSAGDDAPVP
jgi:hypothetical protein